MNCKLLQAEIEKEVFEVQIKNVNKQLTEYTTDQINHTIALYIMKKCCEDGKISRTAYEKMTRKYENKILEKNKFRSSKPSVRGCSSPAPRARATL